MENGTYGKGNRRFDKLQAAMLPMNMRDPNKWSLAGCGANSISLLTGEHPIMVSVANRGKSHFSDDFMRRHLKKNGISSYRLTKCSLSRAKPEQPEVIGQITNLHVLLVSQLIKKNEASWFVYWNGIGVHNFQMEVVSFSILLNFPIVSAYVLYNPKWQ